MNERTVALRRRQGEIFGFKLLRATEDGAGFRLTDVVEHGCAYGASLRNEDRLIEINGQDVRSKSYDECAELIRNTGNTLTIKVIHLSKENPSSSLTNHIPDFLKPESCMYSTQDNDYNDSSIIQCFEFLKPYCKTPEGALHTAFNTIIDEPLNADILARILSDATSPADGLTPYIIDSLKRYHLLNDIINCLTEALAVLVDDDSANTYEELVDQLTKRLLLVQALESMSYDSQRFLCNFIRKNDLPIPLSYRIWIPTNRTIRYQINFNCLMETLCVTDLRLLLQFGSPSASGLGKTYVLGYLFNDKRPASFFTETADRSWRNGCVDVLFANQFVVFDVHGTVTDMRLLRAIQLYTSVQIIYLTEEDLRGDFLQNHVLPTTHTITVIFDPNYDNLTRTKELLERCEERFKELENVLWTSAPPYKENAKPLPRIIKQRNKRLRDRFTQLLEQVKSTSQESVFRSCFQIQSSFYQSIQEPSQLVFDVETELNRLFSSLSDQTENLLLITPITYQRSRMTLPSVMNDYHTFTISLLIQRTYIEFLITEIYLEKWRAAYAPKLREEQDSLRDAVSEISKKLNSASSDTSDLRQRREMFLTELKAIDRRLLNVDLSVGLLCDELLALWDHIHKTQPTRMIEDLQNTFEVVANKLAELVSKGFALHVLRGRPLQSESRLLKMCLEKLDLGNSITVLTVIGAQSSAKSSLLNSTFGCNFRVSAGRCTIGLYLGLAYYKKTTIIILDTEGLMSLEESGSIFDNQMVTMAVLSSNLVLINHKGDISSNLEDLIGMSLYAKIQIQSSPFKPKLFFVLRDQTHRDVKIFQGQLKQLKENIQKKGEFLRGSIDDELEMKHVVLMPGAFTEDTDRDYEITQKWRSETFAVDIHKLRTTLFETLEDQINKFHSNLYSKLIVNWKSIDALGEGLLQCQSLYELTVQNELKDLARYIIADRHNDLQKQAHQSIEKLIQRNIEQIYADLDASEELKPHVWIEEMVREGKTILMELIQQQIEIAREVYDEQTQRTCFAKLRFNQWKNIEGSIQNMKQYLYEQLEMRTLETTLQTNRDYYRRELFHVKKADRTFNDSIRHLNQRMKELEIEITTSLQTCKRNKDDIIKCTLNVYCNVIQTKNANIHGRTTYNLCPLLDYSQYLHNVRERQVIIEKYLRPFLQQSEPNNRSTSLVSKDDDQAVLHWFTNPNDSNDNEHILNFVFSVVLTRINNRLNLSSLHLAYSDPTMLDELIGMIDSEVHSAKIDTSSIHRPSFIRDLIIFMLYLLLEKTNQRFEWKYQQLLMETLNDLHQIQENILGQLDAIEGTDNHGELFRRILAKEIIREVERINRQKLLGEIYRKFNQHLAIDPTDVTRRIYSESIASQPINRTAILKLVTDPNYFCVEQLYLNMKNLCHQLIEIYFQETTTIVTDCMAKMTEVVVRNNCVDAHALHQLIFQQVGELLPGFQASRTIEIEQKIADPRLFHEYFRKLDLFHGETDDVLLKQLIKVKESFRKIVFHECLDTLANRTIGCRACCPGCGIKCELPAQNDSSEEHHHFSRYHLPMAFHGWPCDEEFHPNLSMCYQQWTNPVLFRGDGVMSSPQDFFVTEAPDWYADVREKSEKGEGHAELYPLEEHRRAWMAVRYKLIKEFGLRDQESYHSGIYPMSIVSLSNDSDVLWEAL